MKFKFVVLLIVAFGGIFSVNAQTADEILAKYFANTGGIEKWKGLKSWTQKGKAWQGQEFPMSVYAKTPNKIKMVINVQGTELVAQAYDGTTAWMLNPFAGGKDPVKMPDDQAKELKEDEFEEEFIDYQKKGHEVTLEGKEEVDGVKCFKLKLVKNKNNAKDDVIEIYFFDAENYVPIMQISYVRVGPQKGTEVKTYMSDYQEVNGLMFPFSMEQKVNGQTVFKTNAESMTINDITDDSIFAFPKK